MSLRSLVSPYTFLALSLFALTNALIVVVRSNPSHFYPLADMSARAETVLPTLSLPLVFIYAIPQILLLSCCSRLLARFLCGAVCALIDSRPAFRSHTAKETEIENIVQRVIGRTGGVNGGQ